MGHVVQCRICKTKFDTELLRESEWIRPTPKAYYHKKCYEDWRRNRNNAKLDGRGADWWYESLVDYLYRDIKMSINFSKLISQWRLFTSEKKGMTPKGIYFSVKYYYEVLRGDPVKAQGGIGIVNNIYKDAANYWTNLEARKSGTMAKIIEQIELRSQREVVGFSSKDKEKPQKKMWNLEDI